MTTGRGGRLWAAGGWVPPRPELDLDELERLAKKAEDRWYEDTFMTADADRIFDALPALITAARERDRLDVNRLSRAIDYAMAGLGLRTETPACEHGINDKRYLPAGDPAGDGIAPSDFADAIAEAYEDFGEAVVTTFSQDAPAPDATTTDAPAALKWPVTRP